MITRHPKRFGLALLLGIGFAQIQGIACLAPCDDGPTLDSGSYVILAAGAQHPWLHDAELEIDTDSQSVVIRYAHEGATYEVEYGIGE